MPSGKVHDVITFVLAAPASAAAYWFYGDVLLAVNCGIAFLFGGLMFGPDLDTVSRPYARWGPVRSIWAPYRYFFPHRSRFTHGLVLGALLRVIYFLGVITLIILISGFVYQAYAGGRVAGISDIAAFWEGVGRSIAHYSGANTLLVVFVGLWAGAASHTFTDMTGSFIKTGRSGKFF